MAFGIDITRADLSGLSKRSVWLGKNGEAVSVTVGRSEVVVDPKEFPIVSGLPPAPGPISLYEPRGRTILPIAEAFD